MKSKLTIYLLFFSFFKVYSQQNATDLISKIHSEKDSGLVNAYIEAGRYYSYQGNNDSAEYCFTQALQTSVKLNFSKGIVLSNFRLGEYFLSIGNYPNAMNYFMTALPEAEKGGFDKSIALINRDMGLIHNFQDDGKSAMPYYIKAEKILLRLRDTFNLINLYTDMATCIGNLGDTTSALEYFARNEILTEKKMGSVLSSKKDLPPGKFENDFGSILDKKIIIAYNRVSFIRTSSEFATSLAGAEKLKKLIDSFPNPNFVFRVHAVLCMLLEKTGNYAGAILEGSQALAVFDANEFPSIKGDIAESMAKAYYHTGDYKNAYTYATIHNTIKDSLNAADKFEKIKNMAVKYEAEKKDQQISFLSGQRKLQRKLIIAAVAGIIILGGLIVFLIRSKQLQKNLFVKEQLVQKKELEQKMSELEQTALRAQMNPHFIFNCLNSVQRFVIGRDAEGANHYLSTFASLIRQTLENSGKTLIPLKDEIQYLDTYIKMEQLRSNHGFDYEINVQPDIDTSDVFIPNMIIQPFVENSILHGVTASAGGKGRIRLAFSREDKLVCMLDDNGPGIRTTAETTSVNPAAHVPMGSSITEKRIDIYNTVHPEKIELKVTDRKKSGEDESGTRIVIRFPLTN